jgi:hypothetical protein
VAATRDGFTSENRVVDNGRRSVGRSVYVRHVRFVGIEDWRKPTGLDLTLYRGKKGIISGKVVGTRICFDPAADHETTRPLEERYQRKETTPLSGVEMRLQGRSDHFSIKVYQEEFATTDEAGDYQFKNLPPGFYEVRAMSVRRPFVRIRAVRMSNSNSNR